MITLSQVVGMSAIANYIDPFQDHSHSDDQNTLLLPLGSNHLLLFLKRIILCGLIQCLVLSFFQIWRSSDINTVTIILTINCIELISKKDSQ